MRQKQHADTNSSDEDEYGDLKEFEVPHAHKKDQDITDNDIYT